MARVYGIQGNVVGKIANSVYAVVKGVNVVRAYNGTPSNPQTPLQVAQRAKLKLMSQISAAVAPAIAFTRKGLVSPRNEFVKANISAVTFNAQTDVASFNYAGMDLTGGVLGLPAPEQSSRTGNTLGVALSSPVDNVDVVVYVVTAVSDSGAIRIIGPVRVDDPGVSANFEHVISNVPADAEGYILAFGIRFNNEDSRAKYQRINFSGDNCDLSVIRTMLENNFTTTRTVSGPFAPAG